MGTKAQAAPVEKPIPCIARQPILTADESVVGYELFFREDRQQRCFTSDGDSATSAAIDTLSWLGSVFYATDAWHSSTARTRCC